MPRSDDTPPVPEWPPSPTLDAELTAMRERMDMWIVLMQECARQATAIEQRLQGLQLAYLHAADYAIMRILPKPLSRREIQVLRLVARGLGNAEIGKALDISAGTVKNHMTSILAKLRVHRRMDAVARARMYGII